MDTKLLSSEIKRKKSFLCLGLDSDLDKIPTHLLTEKDPVFVFNKMLIDSLSHLIVAVKINTAFYEAYGSEGWISLEKTINYLNSEFPNIFTIADAKRGDIGNTSDNYAKAFFNKLSFDSITVSPYMGRDSIEPFLKYKNKNTILLALTSNKGSEDFQFLKTQNSKLFEEVIIKSKSWKGSENLMYVVGATKSNHIKRIRNLVPESFILVPGVGAQGGSIIDVFKNGANKDVGILINSSRSILFAGNGEDFVTKSIEVAQSYQKDMEKLLISCK